MDLNNDTHLTVQEIISRFSTSEKPEFDNSDMEIWLLEMAEYHAQHPNERHGLYESVTDRALELRTHFNYDAPISEKILEKRPTEAPTYLAYRESAWEPITYSMANKAINFFSKVFNAQLSSVEYNVFETASISSEEDIQSYMNGDIPVYESESNFVRNIILRATLQDPDGWICVMSKTPIEEREVNQLPDPYPQYIPSEGIICYTEEFVFAKSPEKIVLEDTELGFIFFAFTNTGTWKIQQSGKFHEFRFDLIEIDRFDEKTLPIRQLKGIPKLDFDTYLSSWSAIEYDSHIQPMIPFLNKLMQISSDIDAMLAMHIYLQKMEVKTNCKTCDGKKRVPHPVDKTVPFVPCPTCKGNGFDSVSIFDTMRIGQKAFAELKGIPDLVKYVKIPTDVIKLVFEREDTYKFQAFEAINLEFLVRKQVSGVESAKKVQLEQVPLHVMLGALSKDVFESAQFVARWINIIRYGPTLGVNTSENLPIYKAPDRFDIQSAMEAVEELEKTSNIKNAPSSLLASTILNASSKKYGEDSQTYKAIESEVTLDPLFAIDEGEILSGIENGFISRLEADIHFNLRSYLSDLREIDPDFDSLPFIEKRAKLYELPSLESELQ